jgi:alkanesulfonate monooxygenase SsuD/methylene tetrahydromethanopterin reductase-like flavin-dependent oxidoreductase (luciferase family)
VIYDAFDPFTALTAAAAVTTRVKLATNIAIGPIRNTTLLARQTASLHALSNGRLLLGLAIGARQEDYDAVGAHFSSRARRFADQLDTLRALWEEQRVGPQLGRISAPPIFIGGASDATFARVARYADGYMHGGGPARAFARAADKARAAWEDQGRMGAPLLWGQGYFALGSAEAAETGARYLREYYAFTGPFAEKVAEGLLTTPQAIAQFLSSYADTGCDEVALYPTIPNLEQLDLLVEALSKLSFVEAGR